MHPVTAGTHQFKDALRRVVGPLPDRRKRTRTAHHRHRRDRQDRLDPVPNPTSMARIANRSEAGQQTRNESSPKPGNSRYAQGRPVPTLTPKNTIWIQLSEG